MEGEVSGAWNRGKVLETKWSSSTSQEGIGSPSEGMAVGTSLVPGDELRNGRGLPKTSWQL